MTAEIKYAALVPIRRPRRLLIYNEREAVSVERHNAKPSRIKLRQKCISYRQK